MIFSNESLERLECAVKERLSEKRFNHTLGVVRAAVHIAGALGGFDESEIRAAALLHDVAKEMSAADAIAILMADSSIDEGDLMCPPAHHSFVAPSIIKRDFRGFATDNVLSAVRNHTTGDSEMSDFDMIIFIADYVEEGRTYRECVALRDKLHSGLSLARDGEEARWHLYDAVIECLDNTIRFVLARGLYLHGKTVSARNNLLAKRPKPLNWEEK